MFSSAVNVVDYVMEDYMVLANYVQAFEGKTVMASNSPLLEKYPALGIDYGTVNGSGRIVYAQTRHEPEPTEETVETLPEETAPVETAATGTAAEKQPDSFPALSLTIAAVSFVLLICVAIIVRKMHLEKKKK